MCVGPALDLGEDTYLDPTRRVYQTSDGGREGRSHEDRRRRDKTHRCFSPSVSKFTGLSC